MAPDLSLGLGIQNLSQLANTADQSLPQLVITQSVNLPSMLADSVARARPDLVLIDSKMLNPQTLQLIEGLASELNIDEDQPVVVFVIITQNAEEAQAYKDLKFFATHFPYPQTISASSAAALAYIAGLHSKYQEMVAQVRSRAVTPVRISETALAAATAQMWQPQMVAIWSPKGGVGKTTIAVNLAAALAYYGNRRVLLIDSDMNRGDVHTHLNLQPRDKNIFGLAVAFHANNRLTTDMVKERLIQYERIPLFVLCGPTTLDMGSQPQLTGDAGLRFAEQLVLQARPTGDQFGLGEFVIVDVGQKIGEALHFPWLRGANRVFVIVTPDIASLEEALEGIQTMRKLATRHGFTVDQRFALVMNKWDPRLKIDMNDVLRAMQITQIATLPYDHNADLQLCQNRGVVPVIAEPQHPFSAAIVQLAGQLFPLVPQVWQTKTAGAKGVPVGTLSTNPPSGDTGKKKFLGIFG